MTSSNMFSGGTTGASWTRFPLVTEITCSSGMRVESSFMDLVMTLSTMGSLVSWPDSSTSVWVSLSSGTVIEIFFRIFDTFGSGDTQVGMREHLVVGMVEELVWMEGLRIHH